MINPFKDRCPDHLEPSVCATWSCPLCIAYSGKLLSGIDYLYLQLYPRILSTCTYIVFVGYNNLPTVRNVDAAIINNCFTCRVEQNALHFGGRMQLRSGIRSALTWRGFWCYPMEPLCSRAQQAAVGSSVSLVLNYVLIHHQNHRGFVESRIHFNRL